MTDPTCSCCAGLTPSTPARVSNRPGLTAIARRAGTHASFKVSILAGLSGRDVPALAGLGARNDDDLTIAIADGFSVMADVLTFYQERVANEAYLRTATERRSVLELARLIGYRLAPGVAAETWLAFTLDEARAPGGPPPEAVTIDAGTRVQSVPGQNETAQTFETIAAITAHAGWNALRAQTQRPQPTHFGQRELFLAGTGYGLAPGDVVLLVGDERSEADAGSERWDVRTVSTVELDQNADTTRITWREGLGSAMPHMEPAAENVRAYVFRQRASLFGHNAPDPRLLRFTRETEAALVSADPGEWKNFALAGTSVDLDQAYPKVVPGSWVLLQTETVLERRSLLAGYAELYQARTVAYPSVSNFGMASKVTRIGLDTGENLSLFTRRETLVLCQAEELPMADRPVRSPVFGDRLAFEALVPGLRAGAPLAVSGCAQHLRVAPFDGPAPTLELDDGTAAVLAAGDRLMLLAAPTSGDARGGRLAVDPDALEVAMDPLAASSLAPILRWRLEDRDGRAGTIDASAAAFRLDPALTASPTAPGDPVLAEVVEIAALPDAVVDDRDRTTVRLASPLGRAYDRATLRVNANVARATHGESVDELLGGGDAGHPNQRLRLHQAPLTYIGADTPSGTRSTLTVRVAGTAWEERATLYEAARTDHAYTIEIADDATAEVVIGDGVEGARLPSGQANVRASYRKGIGAAANVRAGQLTTLLLRPLGLNAVVNPEPASGGEDPQHLAQARENAPLTVLTLDRAVSRLDYADFARAFAGIAKADATWIANGPERGVVVTVAGLAGARVVEGDPLHLRLVEALRTYGDPLLPLRVISYQPIGFYLSLDVKVDAAEEAKVVLEGVRTALVSAFAFDARSFGQSVSIDEVAAIAHGVKGVIAIDVTTLRRSDQPATPPLRPRLDAVPASVAGTHTDPAELLTLDTADLQVGTMP